MDGKISQRLRAATGDGQNGERARLRRVPQRGISVYELLTYAILPFLLIMAGAMPSAAVWLMPIILPFLYVLYRRFGAYFPLACVFVYGAISLAFNYDILTVVYFCALFFALCGLLVSCQISPYLACAACAAVFAVVGAMLGVCVVRLAEGVPISEIATRYVLAEREDPVISFFARDYYEHAELAGGEIKLEPKDEGYALAAATVFSEWASDEFGYYIWYYCVHYGALAGAVGYFIAVIVNRRTASCYDCDATEAEISLSTRALGGVRVETAPIADMKLPRAYLWSCLLPAAVAAMILEFVGGYDFLSATVMHAFVTLPSAFGCYTLLAYFASLFKGKARTAANVVLVVVGIAAVIFPMALFVLSIIGVCDCILNLRYWTNFIMTD